MQGEDIEQTQVGALVDPQPRDGSYQVKIHKKKEGTKPTENLQNL